MRVRGRVSGRLKLQDGNVVTSSLDAKTSTTLRAHQDDASRSISIIGLREARAIKRDLSFSPEDRGARHPETELSRQARFFTVAIAIHASWRRREGQEDEEDEEEDEEDTPRIREHKGTRTYA